MSTTQPSPETSLSPRGEVSLDVLKYKEELATKMGLPSPYGMGLMKELARDLVDSGMVPKHFSGNPMGVYMAALRGREMELEPMEAVMETFWSAPGGNLGMYAKKMLQLMHRGGVTSKFLREDAEGCEILFTPPGNHEPYTAKFSIEEAQTAGLDKPDSNWRKWRADMNRARAISRGYRALLGTFGKLSTFGGYSKEEMEDTGMLTTGEPTAADETRLAQLQQRYHVGPKDVGPKAGVSDSGAIGADAPAGETGTASAVSAPVSAMAAPAAKPKKKDKAPDAANVVEMPPQTQQAQPQQRVAYLIYATPIGSENHVQLASEPPQAKLDAASLRAQALANQFGVPHFVYPEIDGKVVPNPVFTATVPDKSAPASPARQEAQPPQHSQTAQPATAAPTGDAKPSLLRERFKAISKKVAEVVNNGLSPDKMWPEKTVAGRVGTFFMGYFQVPTLKELPPVEGNEAAYDQAFLDLESVAANDANSLMSAPDDTGKRKASNTLRMGGFLLRELKWWPENADLGFALMRKWNLEFQEMQTFFENAKLVRNNGDGMQSAAQEDIRAALQLCLSTRAGGRFIRECNTHNVSIAATLHWMEERRFMGKKLAEVAGVDVEKAIEWASTAIKERAEAEASKSRPAAPPRKREPEPEPQASSAPPADDDEGGLFSDLP